MKIFNLYALKTKISYFLYNIGARQQRWGRVDNSFLAFMYYKEMVILDSLKIFLSIKKLIILISKLSFNSAILLTFFNTELFNSFKDEWKSTNVKNIAIIFISKIFGFITSFLFFIVRIKNLRKQYITNYSYFRRPTLIFLTKKCWKIYPGMFRFFLHFRIICIKSMSLNDVEANPGFSLLINDCMLFFSILKYIYYITDKFIFT